MANKILDNAAEAKKYLEEVMGIVEDEEFNKDRRKKLLALKRKYRRESIEKKQNTSISNRKTDCDDIANDASCWVKVKKSFKILLPYVYQKMFSVNICQLSVIICNDKSCCVFRL